MSTTRLYQMYDLLAEAGAGPILSEKRDGPAIRAFNSVLENKNTLPGQYPDHFELRFLGEQDDQTSFINALIVPQTIATGRAWKASKDEPQDQPQLALNLPR